MCNISSGSIVMVCNKKKHIKVKSLIGNITLILYWALKVTFTVIVYLPFISLKQLIGLVKSSINFVSFSLYVFFQFQITR